jgi:peptide-methionine (R)-S-oxide reductase
VNISEDELKKKLTPEQYKIIREGGTEVPFTGKYLDHKEDGTYVCMVCGAKLFSSNTKYDSHTPGLIGWPSFSEVMDSDAIEVRDDYKLGMRRVEVLCKNCGSHLGHLFDDADAPGGKHYCINSTCLNFEKKK